ncbi:MAG: hypothetical protein NTY88_02085 [Bacteroidetes bacterium]|nr:hypothetical protein [Bacteroidota bacterium]
MEQQQDELFQLIKALNKSEKKFFTQYVNLYEKGSSPMYLQVFDFFNLEESYDEEKLFKKFRDPLFKKNYAVTKHYLKNLIVKTLRHGELTVREDRDLTVFILDVKRLMAKGLFGMAKKMIEKLKEEANTEGKFMDVVNLIAMQRGLISMGYYRHQPEVNLDVLDEEEELVIEKIRQLREVMNLSIKLYGLMNYEMLANPDEARKAIEALGKKKTLRKLEELSSAKAKHTFLNFWTLYYCAIGDYKKYLEWANKKLEFVKQEKLPPTVSNWLILGYNHCLAASLLTNEFTDFEARLKFLESMELQSHFHDADRFTTVSIFGLLYAIKQNNEKKILYYINYSNEGLHRLSPFIRKTFNYTLRSIIAYGYLKLKDVNKCLIEVNDLMALTNGETRKDYVGHVKIINLMLRYEMKEYQFLSYLLKNTYRFFMHYLFTSPVHDFVIAYMKEAMKSKEEKKLLALNEVYLNKLHALKFQPTEADLALVMMIEDHLKKAKS